jgi:hypothetical protein
MKRLLSQGKYPSGSALGEARQVYLKPAKASNEAAHENAKDTDNFLSR